MKKIHRDEWCVFILHDDENQESYIRREKKYQEEIEGLKDKLKQHQDVLSADVQMENIRKQHAQVLRRLANMKSNFVGYLGEHETKLITAFRVKLYDVMHESDEKKQDVSNCANEIHHK